MLGFKNSYRIVSTFALVISMLSGGSVFAGPQEEKLAKDLMKKLMIKDQALWNYKQGIIEIIQSSPFRSDIQELENDINQEISLLNLEQIEEEAVVNLASAATLEDLEAIDRLAETVNFEKLSHIMAQFDGVIKASLEQTHTGQIAHLSETSDSLNSEVRLLLEGYVKHYLIEMAKKTSQNENMPLELRNVTTLFLQNAFTNLANLFYQEFTKEELHGLIATYSNESFKKFDENAVESFEDLMERDLDKLEE